MVNVLEPFRWLALRLGLLFSILALTLLAPLLPFYVSVPADYREKASRYVTILFRFRVPAFSHVLNTECIAARRGGNNEQEMAASLPGSAFGCVLRYVASTTAASTATTDAVGREPATQNRECWGS